MSLTVYIVSILIMYVIKLNYGGNKTMINDYSHTDTEMNCCHGIVLFPAKDSVKILLSSVYIIELENSSYRLT